VFALLLEDIDPDAPDPRLDACRGEE
jgi:hypothetical protein